MTLVELMLAMTITVMVVGAIGGLTRTVQQGFEYSEGYGIATQHARVALERIARNVRRATASSQFPGCIVVAESVDGERYPDTLVIWRPSGTAANPTGLPIFSELVVYCPNPADPSQLVEMTKPSDTQTVPAVSDEAAWQSAIDTFKKAAATQTVVLSGLLRTCSPSGGTANLRGAARFETCLRPSDVDWANYQAGTVTWMNLPWVQGLYGPKAGLRQTWVRMELQFVPGVDWVASNAAAGQAVPFFGSAALYYNLSHP